ncbi:hypothetical protein, partial [Pseudomonas syringae group genomosp. 7]|uniref:hypothetical protein n=1 Tax=Pseudomonas syringae group genomosp. 7 TaxID=251699 RepID=UPI00376FACA9
MFGVGCGVLLWCFWCFWVGCWLLLGGCWFWVMVGMFCWCWWWWVVLGLFVWVLVGCVWVVFVLVGWVWGVGVLFVAWELAVAVGVVVVADVCGSLVCVGAGVGILVI